ncbi:lipopolysaccharide-induced tumor necrosis factor-alpha factor homolog [Cottoperca gobio]|uniref:Lipopolysaccharide-induced tumor necrosis factor-alpha factor homolog n=1 Tax=Cottoperca gobio TaxID=56716 RepID=A0A6J2Q3Q7_COTGO|nr:lipopolysaccharide-induced tumor necrosis factor-alpha factor homolog [Cottoperca gobio]
MENKTKEDETFTKPPQCFVPDESETVKNVRIYHVHSPFSPPPPSSSLTHSPLAVSPAPTFTPKLRFVNYETRLYRLPALTNCPACKTQVTTQVTYQVGWHAWFMCLVFVICGLVLGCCLIPFFVKYFKDAYHTCPRCQRVLHIHRRTCCE